MTSYKQALNKKAFLGQTLKALKMFPRVADKALGRYITLLAKHPIKTTAGTAVATAGGLISGSALSSIFFPEEGRKIWSNVLYGPRKTFEDAVASGAQKFADTMTKQHPLMDKGKPVLDENNKPVMVPGVIQRLSKNFSQHAAPALTGPMKSLSNTMKQVAQNSANIGKAFGENLGEGIKSTGGKVLTGAGGAALGYTLSDFIQGLFSPEKETPFQRKRRRVINILAALVSGGAGAHYSNQIYKFLD